MDEVLKGLVNDLDNSILEFQKNEDDVRLLRQLIQDDDIDSLRNLLSDNVLPKFKKDSKRLKISSFEHSPKHLHKEEKTVDNINLITEKEDDEVKEDIIFDTAVLPSSQIEKKKSYQNMEEKGVLYDKELCANKRVSKIEWCHDEHAILASSYISKKSINSKQLNGLVLIWDINSLITQNHKPLNTLEFTNTITTIKFVKNEPFLILGGTNTGRLVLWDRRTQRKSPCIVSFLPQSLIGNSEVVGLKVTQSEFYSPIMAIHANTRVCKWKLSMLAAPEEVLFEGNPFKLGTAMCADISETPDDQCIFGTYNGNIVSIDPYSQDESKVSVLSNLKFPVTSISFHRSIIEGAHYPLFLSTSFDCSVRVWNAQKKSQLLVDNKFKNSFIEARWCPSHPGIYATSDALGLVNLCNAANNSVSFSHYKNDKPKLFPSIGWSSNGTTLACGKNNGKIILVHVDEKLVTPDREDLSKLNALTGRQAYKDQNFSQKNDFSLDESFKNVSDGEMPHSSTPFRINILTSSA